MCINLAIINISYKSHEIPVSLVKSSWFPMVFLWLSFNSPWKPSTSPLLWNSPRDRETFAPRRCHRRTPFSPASPRDSPRQKLGQKNVRLRLGDLKLKLVSNENGHSTRKTIVLNTTTCAFYQPISRQT